MKYKKIITYSSGQIDLTRPSTADNGWDGQGQKTSEQESVPEEEGAAGEGQIDLTRPSTADMSKAKKTPSKVQSSNNMTTVDLLVVQSENELRKAILKEKVERGCRDMDDSEVFSEDVIDTVINNLKLEWDYDEDKISENFQLLHEYYYRSTNDIQKTKKISYDKAVAYCNLNQKKCEDKILFYTDDLENGKLWTKEELEKEKQLLVVEAEFNVILNKENCVLDECSDGDESFQPPEGSVLKHVYDNCFGSNRESVPFLTWTAHFVSYRIENDFNEAYTKARLMFSVLKVAKEKMTSETYSSNTSVLPAAPAVGTKRPLPPSSMSAIHHHVTESALRNVGTSREDILRKRKEQEEQNQEPFEGVNPMNG